MVTNSWWRGRLHDWCGTRFGCFISWFLQIVPFGSWVKRWHIYKKNVFIYLFIRPASDYNTTIYTMATSGTDHVIKLWRLYCLRDLKSPKGRSRLVPSTPQVIWSDFSSSTVILNDIFPGAHLRLINHFWNWDDECWMRSVHTSPWELRHLRSVRQFCKNLTLKIYKQILFSASM